MRMRSKLIQALSIAAAFIGVLALAGCGNEPSPEEFVLVEGGRFQMGSEDGQFWEAPVHPVTVQGFYLGKYEVTQKDWEKVMGSTIRTQMFLAKTRDIFGEGDDYPIYYVSWEEAALYCNKRSEREGLSPAYYIADGKILCDFLANGYRLPTEAEWEFAAKGGNKAEWEFADQSGNKGEAYIYSGSDHIEAVAWYADNSGHGAHPVGTKAPNSLGIYDMSGNVWEWTWDWYGSYSNKRQMDPTGPSSGKERVYRGGCWSFEASDSRTSYRSDSDPSERLYTVGFRLVRSLSDREMW